MGFCRMVSLTFVQLIHVAGNAWINTFPPAMTNGFLPILQTDALQAIVFGCESDVSKMTSVIPVSTNRTL